MIEFEIHQLFPDFILADRNGYAMAKAIERTLQIMCETVQTGVDNLQDIDRMPEWRLDEMAWELGCLYDYNANIEIKRRWVRDATPLYAALGTPQAIYNFLEGFFEQVELEENWQYAGEAYHFRVTVSGEWTDANEAWLRRAIASAKNVRSVLDDAAIGSGAVIAVRGEGSLIARFPYPMTDVEQPTGIYPQENIVARTMNEILTVATRDAQGNKFPYPLAGERPQENTLGAIAGTEAFTQSDGKATAFSYSPCAEAKLCGEDF